MIGGMSLPPVIDAHHRLHPREAPPDELAPLLEECGVERTVLVQPEPSLDATRAALDLAGGVSWVAGASVWADVAAPDAGAVLDEIGAHPKLRGLCLAVDGMEGNHWLTEEPVVRGLRDMFGGGHVLQRRDSFLDLPAIRSPPRPAARVGREAVT